LNVTWRDDRFHDECGLFGIWNHPEAGNVTYLGLYALGRFWVEGLRTDSLMLGQLRVAQVVSVVSVLLAIIGIPLLARRRRA